MLLSVILTVTTLFPHVSVTTLSVTGASVLGAAIVGYLIVAVLNRRGADSVTVIESRPEVPREQWTMPPATLLSRPQWSRARHTAMLALGSYMVVALVLLIVKSVQLAGG
jgi:hypothetical protein